MGKRIAIVIVIALIAGLAIMGYFLQQGRKTLLTDPYKTIPGDACVVIETIDLRSFFNSLTTGKGLFGEAWKVKELSGFSQQVRYLADLLNKQSIREIFSDCSAVISFHGDMNGNLATLLSLPVPAKIKLRHVRDMLASAGVKDLSLRNIERTQVIQVPYISGETRDTAYISMVSGLMVCSNSIEIVQKAISQVTSGTDIRNVPGFSRVLKASGKTVDKVFIVFHNLPDLLRPVLSPGRKAFAEKITSLAGVAGGDIYLGEDGLVLSGYTECTDSSQLLEKFNSLPARDLRAYKILSSSTVLFESLIVPSLTVHNVSDTMVAAQSHNLAETLRPYMGEEITRAILDIHGQAVQDNSVMIYELSSRDLAEQRFQDVAGARKEILYFQPDDQVKIPVYKADFKGLIDTFLPGYAPQMNETYFTFFDNFMISGNSFQTISKLLYDNILNKTLANDLSFSDFENSLPSRAGYFFYCIPSRITDYLEGYLKEGIIDALIANRGSLAKIQAAGYQLSSSNGMIYNSLSVKFKDIVREESKTEWETLLDTVAVIKPFFFTNHLTGAREIFVQDMKNNTYLINAAGRILWKVPLNERIVSGVNMIDYYRNGKYQLMFSGKNYLHILDRNGNYVERFPVKLRSPATNSMVMFDYDNNQNYRIFIAGEDKQIYCYDKTGSVVKGWKPFRTSGIVKSDINYFKVSGKDYIVAADESALYFLDRNGSRRMTLNEPVVKATGSTLKMNPGPEPYLVCSSPDGTIQQVYFDGTVKKISIRKFTTDHSFDFFDVDGDGSGEYIYIDKGILYLYNHNLSELFSRDFGTMNLGGPVSLIFSATDRKIGVIDMDKNLIYLVDKSGKTTFGFPVRGASMFSVGKLSDRNGWHLIVGGTDRFLYNYKIEAEIK